MLDNNSKNLSEVINNSKQCPALILNADYRPLSYFPLSLWPWQDSIKAIYLDRVNVLAEYEDVVRSANLTLKIPSVIALKAFVSPSKEVPFSRFNLFLRDEFRCQYCGKETKELTFDHVVPRVKGGKTRWDNVVAACSLCNFQKAAKSASQFAFKLKSKPIRPSAETLLNNGRKFPPQSMHKTWEDFL
jgi:5-methylcytosine-specific restriction endonuclease McrA